MTVRAPRRRLDLALPHQVPLAELLPDVVRRAGEVPGTVPPGGWVLRRADGDLLVADAALASQGVRDGDVLYLVPKQLSWPTPRYDDIAEQVAEDARGHSPMWGAPQTRVVALAAACLVGLVGLGVLVTGAPGPLAGSAALGAAVVLLTMACLLSRAVGHGAAGAVAASLALPYAASGCALFVTGAEGRMLVGAGGLLFASVACAVAVGTHTWAFVAGGTVGILGVLGAVFSVWTDTTSAAAILVVLVVAGTGVAPWLAVRLGGVPSPVVSADPQVIAAEERPDPTHVQAAVVRADDVLVGTLLGIAAVGAACVALLAAGAGVGRVLAGLASLALVVRARIFPAVATRLPLLAAGLVGIAVTSWMALEAAGAAPRLAVAALAFAAVAGLIALAAVPRRRPESPLTRIADVLDIGVLMSLAPVACAVLGLYAWARTLVG